MWIGSAFKPNGVIVAFECLVVTATRTHRVSCGGEKEFHQEAWGACSGGSPPGDATHFVPLKTDLGRVGSCVCDGLFLFTTGGVHFEDLVEATKPRSITL